MGLECYSSVCVRERQREKCERSCFSEYCVQKCTVRHISPLPLNTFNKDPAETGGERKEMMIVCCRLGSVLCSLDEKSN